MARVEYWYQDNSMLVRLVHLRDARDGTAVTDATVEATLADADGEPVDGETWPLTLESDGAGSYTAVASHEVEVDSRAGYTLQVRAERTGVGVGYWTVPVYATARVP